jgi:hypothetical protein
MSRSSITTTELLPNPHPGEILLKEFLHPMTLSQTALARAIGVPPRRINEIVLGKRAIHRRHRSASRPLFRPQRWVFPAAANRSRSDGAKASARRETQGDQAEK